MTHRLILTTALNSQLSESQGFFEQIQEHVDSDQICIGCNRSIDDDELEQVQKYVSIDLDRASVSHSVCPDHQKVGSTQKSDQYETDQVRPRSVATPGEKTQGAATQG